MWCAPISASAIFALNLSLLIVQGQRNYETEPRIAETHGTYIQYPTTAPKVSSTHESANAGQNYSPPGSTRSYEITSPYGATYANDSFPNKPITRSAIPFYSNEPKDSREFLVPVEEEIIVPEIYRSLGPNSLPPKSNDSSKQSYTRGIPEGVTYVISPGDDISGTKMRYDNVPPSHEKTPIPLGYLDTTVYSMNADHSQKNNSHEHSHELDDQVSLGPGIPMGPGGTLPDMVPPPGAPTHPPFNTAELHIPRYVSGYTGERSSPNPNPSIRRTAQVYGGDGLVARESDLFNVAPKHSKPVKETKVISDAKNAQAYWKARDLPYGTKIVTDDPMAQYPLVDEGKNISTGKSAGNQLETDYSQDGTITVSGNDFNHQEGAETKEIQGAGKDAREYWKSRGLAFGTKIVTDDPWHQHPIVDYNNQPLNEKNNENIDKLDRPSHNKDLDDERVESRLLNGYSSKPCEENGDEGACEAKASARLQLLRRALHQRVALETESGKHTGQPENDHSLKSQDNSQKDGIKIKFDDVKVFPGLQIPQTVMLELKPIRIGFMGPYGNVIYDLSGDTPSAFDGEYIQPVITGNALRSARPMEGQPRNLRGFATDNSHSHSSHSGEVSSARPSAVAARKPQGRNLATFVSRYDLPKGLQEKKPTNDISAIPPVG